MKFKSDQTYQKLRGGYYTPIKVARFLTSFAITSETKTILEPSCGDGVFIEALLDRAEHISKIHAVELDPIEAVRARETGKSLGRKLSIRAGDYFCADVEGVPDSKYDAIIGNPPYIRYQFLEPSMQDAAVKIFSEAGLKFSKHTNSWVTFVVDALTRLNPGGRLAMIVPSELLNVKHSGSLRRYLLEQCSKVLVVDNQELVFENALQGTVFLLAQKKGNQKLNTPKLCVRVEKRLSYLSESAADIFEKSNFESVEPTDSKWMTGLLTQDERRVLALAESMASVKRFGEIAEVEVGMVTGANSFFLVPDSIVNEYGLHEIATPMIGRTQHVLGIRYTTERHLANREKALPVNFLDFTKVNKLGKNHGMDRYIRVGEELGLSKRYKTSIRSPWYVVPSNWAPQLFLMKRSHYVPKLVLNQANALNTDTAYRVTSKVPPSDLAFSFYNSLTAISAELEGRSYGGGVLELVPSEIRKLLVPLVTASQDQLGLLDEKLLNREPNSHILEAQDTIVLSSIGLSKIEIRTIQNALKKLQSRRLRQEKEFEVK